MGKSALFRQFLICMLLVIPATVIADVRVANLYDVDVWVADESLQARNIAQKKALLQMFVRITGKVSIGAHPKIKEALKNYSLYIKQFKYIRKGTDDNVRVSLRVTVNSDQVVSLLQGASLPVWGERRPNTVVWVAIDDGDKRFILNGDDTSEARQVMQQMSKRRGTPLLFPILDFEDQSKVRFSDIWGGFLTPIKKASKRYQTEAILIARMGRRGNGWRSRWTLLVKGNRYQWTSSGQHKALVLSIGIDGAADKLAEHYITDTRYASKSKNQDQTQTSNTHQSTQTNTTTTVSAVKPRLTRPQTQTDDDQNYQTQSNRSDYSSQISSSAFISANPPVARRPVGFYIAVKNLKDLNDYVSIGRYLTRLSSVRTAKILKLEVDTAVFEVIPKNSASNVKQSISVGSELVQVRTEINLDARNPNSNPNQIEFANIVNYRYTK